MFLPVQTKTNNILSSALLFFLILTGNTKRNSKTQTVRFCFVSKSESILDDYFIKDITKILQIIFISHNVQFNKTDI